MVLNTQAPYEIAALPRRERRHTSLLVLNIIAVCLVLGLIASAALNKRFEWDVIGKYLFEIRIMHGIGVTLLVTVIVAIISIVCGTLVALVRLSGARVFAALAGAYIWVFRSLPILVLLLVAYNLAALYPTFFGQSTNKLITPFSSAIIALALHETAYVAEIIRSGLLSVPVGQREAAQSIGMSDGSVFFRVVLPQALRVVLPPLGNQVIALLKATSMVSVISLADLLYSVQLIYENNFEVIPLLVVASFWYIVITGVLTLGQRWVERRFAFSRRAAVGQKPIEVQA